MSQAAFPDDVPVPVVSYGAETRPSVLASGELVGVKEEAVSAQRLAVSRLLKKHVTGKMERAVPEFGRRMVNQKMFRLNKLIEWTDGPPDVVVEALAAGRLRCRLNAAMGLGKSTLLASYVAKALNYRVLHVSLDAHALQQVAIYIHDAGIGRVSRRWVLKQESRVSMMTYADFNGHMATSKRADLFKSFDLIIFDEGFVKNDGDVFVAGCFFSEYALPDTNLILCSGTLRTDVAADEMGSKAVGSFKQLTSHVSVDVAIQAGKLVTDYLVDRTLVLVPTNQKIYDLVAHYEANGVDVKFLDDASDYESLREVESWLKGDGTTPRVAVVYWEYYIAFNFPLAYAVIWPYYSVKQCVDGVCRQVEIPMTESMLTQAKSRTGRGIVDGSGGIVMSPERSEDGELIESERMKAFVKLCAGAIRPLRTPFWESCYRVFPDALPVATAMNILKACLPVDIAARYLGSDGRVAARYCRALNAFAQPDHFLTASDDELPVGYDNWHIYDFVLDEQIDAQEQFKLPYDCEGEDKLVLVAIELIAQDRIVVDRWRPRRAMALNDGYDSDEELRDSRFAKTKVTLRRIVDRPLPPLPNVVPVKAIPWEYRPLENVADVRRGGGYINSDRCRQALLELESLLPGYRVPNRVIEEVVEADEGSVTQIVADGYGDVESPGGSVVCTLPVRICEKMNLGEVLTSTEFIKMATAARVDVERFIASKLFDSFAGAWESLLRSLLIDNVANEVVRKGIASDVYAIVDKLRFRFNIELCSILAHSNIFKNTFLRIFKRTPTADDVIREVKAGKFDRIAQTDGFIDRVKVLKLLIDEVLLHAEKNNVYLPTYITNAQRALPLRGDNRLGYVGDNVHAMPKNIQRMLSPPERKGGGSFDSKKAVW